ncbi:MAG: hypothetical protein FWC50_02310 [Planctomycetaceae bacterium]|nr:hypothetical protein [Planctomycetaceae bacterium]
MPDHSTIIPKRPGVCIPWETVRKEYDTIENEELVRKVWEENDAETYDFLWQMVLSF